MNAQIILFMVFLSFAGLLRAVQENMQWYLTANRVFRFVRDSWHTLLPFYSGRRSFIETVWPGCPTWLRYNPATPPIAVLIGTVALIVSTFYDVTAIITAWQLWVFGAVILFAPTMDDCWHWLKDLEYIAISFAVYAITGIWQVGVATYVILGGSFAVSYHSIVAGPGDGAYRPLWKVILFWRKRD